jgi:HAMP domain-containing protein
MTMELKEAIEKLQKGWHPAEDSAMDVVLNAARKWSAIDTAPLHDRDRTIATLRDSLDMRMRENDDLRTTLNADVADRDRTIEQLRIQIDGERSKFGTRERGLIDCAAARQTTIEALRAELERERAAAVKLIRSAAADVYRPDDPDSEAAFLPALADKIERGDHHKSPTHQSEASTEREEMIADRDRTIEQLRANLKANEQAYERDLTEKLKRIADLIDCAAKRQTEIEQLRAELKACEETYERHMNEKAKRIRELEDERRRLRNDNERHRRDFVEVCKQRDDAQKQWRVPSLQSFQFYRNKMIADTMSALVRGGGELDELSTLFIADLMVWEPKP